MVQAADPLLPPAPHRLATILPVADTVAARVTMAMPRGLGVAPLVTGAAKRGADDPFLCRHDMHGPLAAAELLPGARPALAATRIALIGPQDRACARRAARAPAEAGIETGTEEHLGIAEPLAFAAPDAKTLSGMARRAAQAPGVGPVAGRNAACAAAPLEAELGLPFVDAAALGPWAGLRAACIGASPRPQWRRPSTRARTA